MTDLATVLAGVEQLHRRYGDALWRKDYDLVGDCFTEDAEWRFAGRIVRGRANIVTTMADLMTMFRKVLVTSRTPILHIAAGAVSGRAYTTEQNVLADGSGFAMIAIYYQRYVQQGDRWRFSWRLCDTFYLGPPDLSGPFYDNPDYGPPPAMPPLDAMSLDHTGLST